jgi:hypothetical protein
MLTDHGMELSAEAQAVAQQTSRRLAALIDEASSAQETIMQSAALLARARGNRNWRMPASPESVK